MFKSLKKIFAVMIITTIASTETACAEGQIENQSVQSYIPPSFTDSERLAKIHALLPEIDQMYKEYAEKNHFPGYAYGIVVDGKLFHSGSGGFIDLDQQIPATPQSMFRVASITKSFTAMAIVKLRDEGKLQLDDPVSLYIPELQQQRLTTDAPQITIRDLLTHSAGLPTDNPWGDRKLDTTEDEFLDLMKKGVVFSTVPGTAYEYSNLGYTMLGYIIQKVTGVPYRQFIAETIWQPIGLKEGAWDFTEVPLAQLARGYRWIDHSWQDEELLRDGIFNSMGGMITSIESFSPYVALHLSAWPPRDEQEEGPIKRSSLREMHKPWNFSGLEVHKYPDNRDQTKTKAYGYGLQWFQDTHGRVFLGHSGGLPGFGSNWCMLPEYGIAVILFANVTYAPAAVINREVLEKLVVSAQLAPRKLPPSNVLQERQEALIQFLPSWKNAETSTLFAENFFLDYPIDLLKQETKRLFKSAGKLLAVGEVVADTQLSGSFILACEKMDLRIRFTLTPESPSLIQEFEIEEIKRMAHPVMGHRRGSLTR